MQQLWPVAAAAGHGAGAVTEMMHGQPASSGVKNVSCQPVTPFLPYDVPMHAGAAMFDMEYARWLDDDSKRLAELRAGLQAQLLDGNLGLIVEECMQHYDELFQLKAALARSDVFHLLTGAWATPAERCFFWMGGFRPSELLKVCTVPLRHCVPLPWRPSVQPRPPSQRRRAVLSLFLFFFGMQILIPQLDPLTEQQLLGGAAAPPAPPPRGSANAHKYLQFEV